MTDRDVRAELQTLGMLHLHEHFDDVLALAQKQRMTHVQLLEHIVMLEQQDRARRGLMRRTQRARLGRFKVSVQRTASFRAEADRAPLHATEARRGTDESSGVGQARGALG